MAIKTLFEKGLHFRVQSAIELVTESDAPPKFIRANLELKTLRQEIKKLDGAIEDYACGMIDEGLCDGYFVSEFIILPSSSSDAPSLISVIDSLEKMAALPDFSRIFGV